jgi:hypothetical protein
MSALPSSSLPNDRLKTWALAYASDGLPVFPLSPGTKFPAISKADGGHGFYDATTDTQRIEGWWTRYPGANIGICTGATSGLLVIDVDPRQGGSLDTIYARFPELQEARLAQSGNGGWHLYLRYPGFEVASGNRVLGLGIDVKCDRGYITAHPSHLASGGKYCWLNTYETPLLDCPPALVESLRDFMAARDNRATTSRSPVGNATSSSIGRYSPTANSLLADALDRTSDGVGDDTGFELARKLLVAHRGEVETLAVLISYGEDATANPRDPFTERDARRWLEQARNSEHVRHATSSAVDPAESAYSSVSDISDIMDRTFPLIGQDGRNLSQHNDVAGAEAGDPDSLTQRRANGAFPLLALEDLAKLPHARPEELIPGKLLKRTLNLTYGDGETGKSYYVQDTCFALVAKGVPVWYVAAEGFDGIYLRMLAWVATHPDKSLEAFRVIPVPVQIFRDKDRHILAAQARDLPPELRPALIVLDTLHRCVVGAKENDNSDMVCLANTAALWRSEFGATTWAIHHEGKNAGQGMRGASCLYDDADSVQYIFRGGDISVIECEKQKDGMPRFEPEAYTLESYSLDSRGYPGLSAKVLRPLEADHILEARRLWSAEQQRRQPGAKNAASGDDTKDLSKIVQSALDIFDELAKEFPDGVFKATWREHCVQGGIKAGSFDWVSKALLRLGKVREADTTGRLVRVRET